MNVGESQYSILYTAFVDQGLFFSARWGIRTPQISSILIRIGVDFQGTSRLRWEDVVNLFQIEVVKGTGTKVMLLRCCGWEDGMVFLLELGWWFLRFRWIAASACFWLPGLPGFDFPSQDSLSTNPFVLTISLPSSALASCVPGFPYWPL